MKNIALLVLGSLGFLAAAMTAPAQSNYEPYSVTTFAGSGGSDVFNRPHGVAVDSAGTVYVADTFNHAIRKITPSGIVSTFAGEAGSIGSADGNGSAARFNGPHGIALDSAGNIFVSDAFNQTIRKITPSGVVSTFAGTAGLRGSADGPAGAARFNDPKGLALDGAGTLYVSDTFNHTVRKITSSGVVSTMAGVAGSSGSADGPSSTARFNRPHGVAVDSAGNVYVGDMSNHTIRTITPLGVVNTWAGSPGSSGSADGVGGTARFSQPVGLTIDQAGNVYVADYNNSTIRKIAPTRQVVTLAGLAGSIGTADGTGSAARFSGAAGVGLDNAGKVYVADTNNHTIRVGVASAPPTITSPLAVSALLDQQFIYQFNTTSATSRAVTNLPQGLSFNPTLRAIIGIPAATGTFQVGLSASNANGTTNATLALTIRPAPGIGPVIVSNTAATGRTGRPFTFQVITARTSTAARLSATGLPPGLILDEVSGEISGTATTDGSFAVSLTAVDGFASISATLQLTFSSDPALPVIISPNTVTLTAGQPFFYQIVAPSTAGPADPTFFSLIGNLPDGLVFNAADGTITGSYSGRLPLSRGGKIDLSGGIVASPELVAGNSTGITMIPLNFFDILPGVINISTRLSIGTADNVLIAGFIVRGDNPDGSGAPQKVVIRAIGPSLKNGATPIPGRVQDPVLELRDDRQNLLKTNDNWRDFQENEIIQSTLAPGDNRESAMIAFLVPGSYTALVRGKDGQTGIGVVEVYEIGTVSADRARRSQLKNLSTRGQVQNGDNVMIGGFIVSGGADDTVNVIVRASGPSLTARGVPGALADPTLELFRGSTMIAMNDDWRTTQAAEIIATTVPPEADREAAIVTCLRPGAYTTIVRGKDGTTGVALVELFVLP